MSSASISIAIISELSVRFFLITILGTAATANYQYNAQRIQAILLNLERRMADFPVEFYHANTTVWWRFRDIPSRAEKRFNIVQVNPGTNQQEWPEISVFGGPYWCLFQIGFRRGGTVMNSVADGLVISLAFKKGTNLNNLRIVSADVFTKPRNQRDRIAGIAELGPIFEEQIQQLGNERVFSGSTTWARTLISNQIYIDPGVPGVEGSGDSEDSYRIDYIAKPVVIDERILNAILQLQ